MTTSEILELRARIGVLTGERNAALTRGDQKEAGRIAVEIHKTKDKLDLAEQRQKQKELQKQQKQFQKKPPGHSLG